MAGGMPGPQGGRSSKRRRLRGKQSVLHPSIAYFDISDGPNVCTRMAKAGCDAAPAHSVDASNDVTPRVSGQSSLAAKLSRIAVISKDFLLILSPMASF